jgi:hypothetical protein
MVAVGLNRTGESCNALTFRCRRMNGGNCVWRFEGNAEAIKTTPDVAELFGNGICP